MIISFRNRTLLCVLRMSAYGSFDSYVARRVFFSSPSLGSGSLLRVRGKVWRLSHQWASEPARRRSSQTVRLPTLPAQKTNEANLYLKYSTCSSILFFVIFLRYKERRDDVSRYLFVFAGKSRHEYIKETFETSGDGSLRVIQVMEIISRPSLVDTAICGVQNFHSFSSKTVCQIARREHEHDCFAIKRAVWIQDFFL